MEKFVRATVMTAAVNEVESLKKTIMTITDTCDPEDLEEFVIVLCDRTTAECRKAAESFLPEYKGIPVRIYEQVLPGLGGALRCAMENSCGSHTILMPADEGIDLDAPARMIELAKKNPDYIISTSRWMKGCHFEDYGKIKIILNFAAQIFLRVLFGQKLTDMTNPAQLAPVSIYDRIQWESTDYSLMLEMVLKPLRLGVKFIEIPTDCHKRTEGASGNSPMRTAAYFLTALKVRFMKREDIVRKS